MTEEQALALISRLLGNRREVRLQAFEFGWLAHPQLTPEERSQGKSLGQANYIIDRDGTVTVHPSLSTRMVIRRYAEARQEGRITGRQVWPETDQRN